MAENFEKEPIQKELTTSPSFIKLAMRNMVRKGRQSILHLSFTAFGFITFILIVAWLGKPNIPH